MTYLGTLLSLHQKKPSTPLDRELLGLRKPAYFAVSITFFSVILSFASFLYMINLSERVLNTRSIETFIALTVIVLLALLTENLIENFRSKLLKAAGATFSINLNREIFDAAQKAALVDPRYYPQQALQDVQVVREFLTGYAASRFLEAPFLPIFMVVAYIIHPVFLYILLGSAVLVSILTYLGQRVGRASQREATESAEEANRFAENVFRRVEVVRALGMGQVMRERWLRISETGWRWAQDAEGKQDACLFLAKLIRGATSTVSLAVAAYLIIQQQLSPALLIIPGLILGRALAPLEGLISQLRATGSFRLANLRLQVVFEQAGESQKRVALPKPQGRLTVENLVVAPPGHSKGAPILRNISFDLMPGRCLGIIGPSAAGKSSLLRTLLGIWPPYFGSVRMDGFELNQWEPDTLGSYLGYLPQDIGLFEGTVAENIARFGEMDDGQLMDAIRLAGIEDLVALLPDGLNTRLGEDGLGLSGGQKQRLGLARAVYGKPSVVVLDEPNSNLDAQGEQTLIKTINQLKSMNVTVVFVTHKTSFLNIADELLSLANGTMHAYGRREDVMRELAKPRIIPLQPAQSSDA